MNTCKLINKPLFLSSLILILFLSGCETLPELRKPEGADTTSGQVRDLEEQGRYSDAADLLLQQAEQFQGTERSDRQLYAIELLIRADRLVQAEQWMQTLHTQVVDPIRKTRLLQLQSRIYLQNNQPDQVLATLPIDTTLPAAIQATTHELRAQAHGLSGNKLELARELIQRDFLLNDPQSIQLNREQIWDNLRQLSPLFLAQMTLEPAPDIMSGWMALVKISKTSYQSTEDFDHEVRNWKMSYPRHPASEQILDRLIAHYRSVKIPEKFALLLPLSGKLAQPAAAIRDGFLAAHFNDPNNRPRTNIKTYDTSRSDISIQQLYLQAVAEGAEFVIGPLDKQKVNELASMSLSVPILTLNVIEQAPANFTNFYQFGLNPEDEARQIAEKASLEGMTRAISITPKGDWGTRLAEVFNKRFQELGGVVLEQAQYDFRSNDYSAPIKKILNIDESERRFQSLRYSVSSELKFVPRRRQDVDFIFMAAFPRQARLINPQLRFHHAGDIPVYTTSSAYNGQESVQKNKDLNGIFICDSDWILAPDNDSNPLRKKLDELWPKRMQRYPRLFALGIDAYSLPGQLNWLQNNSAESFEGVTGRLNLNDRNQVQRTLKWGQFRKGILSPIADTTRQ